MKTHINHLIAAQQSTGFGGIVSFSLKTDTAESAKQFVTHTKLFKLAESLGGVKSLCCHPATMTHKSIPEDKRKAAGIANSLIRLSVGLEDVEDLIKDIEIGLANVNEITTSTHWEKQDASELL